MNDENIDCLPSAEIVHSNANYIDQEGILRFTEFASYRANWPADFAKDVWYKGGEFIEDDLNMDPNIKKAINLNLSPFPGYYSPALFIIEQGKIKDNDTKLTKNIRNAVNEADEAYQEICNLHADNLEDGLKFYPFQEFYYKDKQIAKESREEFNKLVKEYDEFIENLYR